MQRWKTLESVARGARSSAARQWYGRRFRVHNGEDATAVPVTAFRVGGVPQVVWRADLDTSLERLLDRLDAVSQSEPPAEGRPPRSRLS